MSLLFLNSLRGHCADKTPPIIITNNTKPRIYNTKVYKKQTNDTTARKLTYRHLPTRTHGKNVYLNNLVLWLTLAVSCDLNSNHFSGSYAFYELHDQMAYYVPQCRASSLNTRWKCLPALSARNPSSIFHSIWACQTQNKDSVKDVHFKSKTINFSLESRFCHRNHYSLIEISI